MSGQRLTSPSPPGPAAPAAARRPARAARPGVEPLEGRQLLSGYNGFSRSRRLLTPAGLFQVRLAGAGVMRVGQTHGGELIVNLLGTTDQSVFTMTPIRSRWHRSSGSVPIRQLNIPSGRIGAIVADRAELDGEMTPLSTDLDILILAGIGPRARLDVAGGVDLMDVGSVELGPTGRVRIGGDLNDAILDVGNGGNGNGNGNGSTLLDVGAMVLDTVRIEGGQFTIGRDSLAPIQVEGDFRVSQGGRFAIARDQAGSFTVGGSIVLDSGGQLSVGRNLTNLSVEGDVLVGPGGGISVGGTLNGFTVQGIFRGQGSPAAIDLGVGLDMLNFTVLGATPNLGGLQDANINVGKSIRGLYVAHGIYRSWITAGVSIDGVYVGPDGNVAVLNSEIDAWTSISNVDINGDLTSEFPTNPQATGYPTRIVAGKSRAGQYTVNGTIDAVTIRGNLVDSVLAASVAPYGGDGSLPPPTPYYGAPARQVGPPPGDFGYSTYDAPAGVTDGTTKNYSIRSTGVPTAVWDRTYDPIVDDTVLANGTVNVSLLGSVVSSPHDGRYDFTGVFAVNTRGVDGGPLP